MKNDLFNRIFIRICIHVFATFGTYILWVLVNPDDEAALSCLWVCIFVANCTTLILGKLNRVIELLTENNR